VAHVISDRVDIEERSMLNAFNRCSEMHISMNRTLKDKPSAAAQYRRRSAEARSADSRHFGGRAVGDGGISRAGSATGGRSIFTQV
jgi:hypothetical protein